ncbi:MarR family winged helix-turn-helix transcriptional regulator [Williamsia phyllosphaerae]|uniref:HTH marR-type domain-containing protein n=1 Tax=Williamsia phyllosphaerae TaxID=885042 RepID=A0ABQ1V5Q7_9NOCA|nr:MarR family winged helix-turn-helix transcriptional regulator [Williamsia phyllosphaerae]GGF37897.1 hypothetical protein GCM10007298_37090 [Williamsia phyllosphaerae]
MSRKGQPRGTPWLTPAQQQTWRSYMGLSLQMTYEMNRQLSEDADLSLADYSVLVALADSEDGRRGLTELATEIGWERSRLSHHLKRMCSRGLTERHPSRTDGRATDATLTSAGRVALESASAGHVDLVQRLFFAPLDETDVVSLGEVLDRLRTHVRDAGTL